MARKRAAEIRSLRRMIEELEEEKKALAVRHRQVAKLLSDCSSAPEVVDGTISLPPLPSLDVLPDSSFSMRPVDLAARNLLPHYCTLRDIASFREFVALVADPAQAQRRRARALDHEVCVCLMLTRIRRNLPYITLGHMFRVSPSTASSIYKEYIQLYGLACKAELRLDRDTLLRRIPAGHKRACPGLVAASDGTYVYLDGAPQGGRYQKCYFIPNKKRHGHKVLVNCCLDGFIFTICGTHGSQADGPMLLQWIDDEQDYVKELFQPGDQLAVDRGYADKALKAKVKNALGMDVTLTHPDMKTAGALSARKVSRSRAIASCRAVVEQVNSRLKEQEVLGGKYPLRETSLLQSVLYVTAHLCNSVYEPLYDLEDAGAAMDIGLEKHLVGAAQLGAIPDTALQDTVLTEPDSDDASKKAVVRRFLMAEITSIDSDFWRTTSEEPVLTPASRSTVEAELRPVLETATVSEDNLSDDELAEDDDSEDDDRREAEAAERSRLESEAKALARAQLEKVDSGEKVTLATLKVTCKMLGVSPSGRKDDIVHRLRSSAFGVVAPSKGKARPVRAKVPCRQFCLWLSLVNVAWMTGTVLTRKLAELLLPKLDLPYVKWLFQATTSVSAGRATAVARVMRSLIRGDNIHIGQNIKYWSIGSSRLLVATKVKASMSSVMYKVFLLFVIDSSLHCRIARSYCECVNGVSLYCQHKAATVTWMGAIQGSLDIPEYRMDKVVAATRHPGLQEAIRQGKRRRASVGPSAASDSDHPRPSV
jgi:hypothetical protein